MQDSYKHQGLRKNLVASIAKKGIKDKRVLAAIEKVPRHLFLDNIFLQFAAYEDKPFQIGAGQTISQPYTVAFQTELLDVQKGERVLEIGTGSGYQTCILLEMGAKVFSIERQKTLYEKTKQLLNALSYTARCFYGDGYKGNSLFAPYDKILVTCGAPFIPDALLQQLKIGGLLVIPLGEGSKQTMTVVLKIAENKFDTTEFGTFSFVPMLSEKAKKD